MYLVSAKELAESRGTNIRALEHPSSRYRKAYLGEGKFDLRIIQQIDKNKTEIDWFRKQIGLFIEYLNKIENISYTEISKRTKISISCIAHLNLGRKGSATVLVKYRHYTRAFEKYYRS